MGKTINRKSVRIALDDAGNEYTPADDSVSTDPVISTGVAKPINEEKLINMEKIPSKDRFVFSQDEWSKARGVSPKLSANTNVTDISWELIYADHAFNVREEDSYTEASLAPLRALIERQGLEEALRVSKQPDGRYKVIRGHRRHAVMSAMRRDHLVAIAKKTVDHTTPMPWDHVPCVVLSLTAEEEIVQMIDHGSSKKLNRLELYKAVQKLHDLGWGEKMVMVHLTETRGNITNHLKVARLPKDVRDAYIISLRDGKKAEIQMGADQINALATAWNTDVKDGTLRQGGGPKYRAAWKAIKEDKSASRGDMRTVAKNVEEELTRAQEHQYLLDYVNGLKQNGDKAKFANARQCILLALYAMFPNVEITEEEGTSDSPTETNSDSE